MSKTGRSQKPKSDPWERLDQLIQESEPFAPEGSFSSRDVMAKKNWSRDKACRWLREQVDLGKLKIYGKGAHVKYYFPD